MVVRLRFSLSQTRGSAGFADSPLDEAEICIVQVRATAKTVPRISYFLMNTFPPRANMILPNDGGKATSWQIKPESSKAVKTREHRPGPPAALRSDRLFAHHAGGLAGSFQ